MEILRIKVIYKAIKSFHNIKIENLTKIYKFLTKNRKNIKIEINVKSCQIVLG